MRSSVPWVRVSTTLPEVEGWSRIFTSLSLTMTRSPSANAPEELAVANEDADFVRELMTYLTEDQRAVVELRLAELTGPEIQQVLGRSRAWVSTTQHRAIKRMREVAAQIRPFDHEGFQALSPLLRHPDRS